MALNGHRQKSTDPVCRIMATGAIIHEHEDKGSRACEWPDEGHNLHSRRIRPQTAILLSLVADGCYQMPWMVDPLVTSLAGAGP